MYRFEKLNEEYFNQIATWKYEGEFSIYDMENHETKLSELLEQENYEFFVGINEEVGELVGYIECFYKDGVLEVGHGLNPSFMGKRLSYDFILESIEFAIEFHDYTGDAIKVCIEPFNTLARKVYSRVGFNVVEEEEDFIEMELEL